MNQSDLRQFPGFQEKVFQAGEAKLNYAIGPKNGPPLLLVHGLGRRWQVFHELIPALSENWQIFAPDLRGHGRSTHVSRGYGGSQYANDIAAFLVECVKGPAVFLGHSLGGMIGLKIAVQHPEWIRALILGDSMLLSKGFHPDSMYPSLFAGLRDLAAQDLSLEEMADGLSRVELKVPGLKEKVCIGDLPGNDRAAMLRWAPCVMQADPDTYAMTLDGSSFEEWNGESLLAHVRCPTLLLQASPELGALMSDADVAAAKRLVPDVRHVRFPTLGHALYIQQPEPILRAVNEFLDGIVDDLQRRA